jgi:glycosyltransferase involved in cell wall biosynthesis
MVSHRYRILHVLRTPVGGLFRHVLDVARGQIERGHEVGILCDSSTGGARADHLLEELRPRLALGVTRVPMRRNPHPLDVAALGAVRRLYRERRPNVLHGHGSKGGAYARLAAAAGDGAIRVYTPHGGSFHYPPGTLRHLAYMAAERFLARRTDLFLFESEYIAGRFRAYVGATDCIARVVHNGLSEAEFEPVAPAAEPFDLMHVGELRPGKGVETLIDALARLRSERGMRLSLLMVGSGVSEEALRARARSAGILDAMTFVPAQPIRQVLGRGRVMVMPSHAESLPYVIIEAAAAGQPLLATNVGGIPEIFGPSAQELVPPADAAALAEAIRRKVAEPEEARAAKADALRQFVKSRFTMARMLDGVLAGYAAAAEASSPARG